MPLLVDYDDSSEEEPAWIMGNQSGRDEKGASDTDESTGVAAMVVAAAQSEAGSGAGGSEAEAVEWEGGIEIDPGAVIARAGERTRIN